MSAFALKMPGGWYLRGKKTGINYCKTGFKMNTQLSKDYQVFKIKSNRVCLYYSAQEVQAPSKRHNSHCARHLV